MKAAKNSNVGERRWIDGDDNECGSKLDTKTQRREKGAAASPFEIGCRDSMHQRTSRFSTERTERLFVRRSFAGYDQ
jgi:hypothetical protein